MPLFGHESCAKDRRELSDRLATVERQLDLLKLEWAGVLDQVTRQVSRLAKRSYRDAAEPREPEGEQPAVDAVTSRILARRGHGILPRSG